ncbi:hypothetical protein RhiirA1_479964 [Rhizophagus irregularis]|uniref:Uncharacterized protein n=1 Tax=Rhizophagus irregularis TaxID=588596 RepID=A0A2I1FK06_9GLOM|nr:hypothetical protein RhiirA1_479964 [Rhizophagus irregularis]PKY34714.1 hypothetical protein RhiirB3_454694 [Rhizophagus irregularis]
MSHWLPTAGPASTSFHPYSGCSRHIPKYATLSAIKRHCTSERCFFQVQLTDTIAYPTKNAKVFATGRPIRLSTSLTYASSLAMVYFNRPPSEVFAPPSDDSPFVPPSSTCELYTDGSFLDLSSGNSPFMSSAWLALDENNLILKSSSDVIPSTYPSTLRSETFALLSALKALTSYSSTIINTDCASLISTWNQFVDKPFLPKLLRQPNHLLWLSIRHYIHRKHLSITLQKVPAKDDIYNTQVDFLAKVALHSPQPTITPISLLDAPCIILFDSLLIDENIRHFLRSIYEAKNLLDFSSLSRFSHLAPVDNFDWKGILFWLSRSKVFTTHHKGLLAFRLKVLLDMLPTLTVLQKRKPSLYLPDWLCSLCHSASEDMNHLWTCTYIIPDASPRSIHHRLLLFFHDACITNFSECVFLSDNFLLEFFALDC